MPTFDFKCSNCGLIFEKFVRDRKTTSYKCLDCGVNAERKKVSEVGFQFEQGKTPGNTGVDSLDSSIDKFVGRDSARRWEAIKDRKTQKRKVQRRNGGEGKVPLRKDPITGEYKPMAKQDVPKFQGMQKVYADMYEDHKKKRKEKGVSKFRPDDPYEKKKRELKKKQGQDDQ